MNKRESARLQKLFPGYTVLSVSDDGLNVCLLSEKDGTAAGYTFSGDADKNGVVAERICAMRANAAFEFDAEHIVNVDLDQITDQMAGQIMRLSADKEASEKRIHELEDQVKAMEAEKLARRMSDAKKAVHNRLDVLNRDRDATCAYAEALAEEVCAKIDSGCFNETCNEKGEWCGDEMAVMQLEALCARAQEKQDSEKAEKARKTVSWNSMIHGERQEDGDDVKSLLNWLEK